MKEELLMEIALPHLLGMRKAKIIMAIAIASFAVPILWTLNCFVTQTAVTKMALMLAGILLVVCSPMALIAAKKYDKHKNFVQKIIADIVEHNQ